MLDACVVRRCLGSVLFALLAAAPAQAQTNWTPTGGGSWNEPSNWSAGVPNLTTLAAFGPNPTGAATVNLDATSLALGIQVTNVGGALTISNGAGTNVLLLQGSGIDMVNAAANLTINATQVALDTNQLWDVRQGRVLAVASDLALGSNLLTLNTANVAATRRADINLTGAVGGSGGLTVNGNGMVTLGTIGSGVANTFTGDINVNGGLLQLNKLNSAASTVVNVNNGHIRIGDGILDTINNFLPATTQLTLSGTATYNISVISATGALTSATTGANHTQTYASVTHGASGVFTTGLNSNITVTGTFTHSGSGTLVVRDRSTLSANAFNFSTGTGQLFLTGASGAAQGRLVVGAGGLTVNSKTIQMNQNAGATAFGSRIELNGPVTVNTGATFIVLTDDVNQRPAEIQLRDPARVFSINGSSALTVATGFTNGTGTGGILKQGTGTLVLGGTATFPRVIQSTHTGTTQIDGGAIRTDAANMLSTASAVVVNGSGSLNLNDFSQTIASLAGSGNVTLGTGTLTTGGVSSTTHSGVVSGATGSFIKQGSGTQTLTGVNTYGGATTINAGTLSIGSGGSLAAGSAVAVNNTGTLGGTGTVNGTVAVASGGTLAPGVAGAGNLTLGGNTVLNSGSELAISAAAPGTNNRLTFQGATTTLDFKTGTILDLSLVSGFGPGGAYTLVTMPTGEGDNVLVNAVATTPGQVLGTFIQGTGASGPVVITPSGFSLGSGDTFTLTRTGDTVLLTFTPVPEPATVLGLAAGVLGVGGYIRRRVVRRA